MQLSVLLFEGRSGNVLLPCALRGLPALCPENSVHAPALRASAVRPLPPLKPVPSGFRSDHGLDVRNQRTNGISVFHKSVSPIQQTSLAYRRNPVNFFGGAHTSTSHHEATIAFFSISAERGRTRSCRFFRVATSFAFAQVNDQVPKPLSCEAEPEFGLKEFIQIESLQEHLQIIKSSSVSRQNRPSTDYSRRILNIPD